MCRVCDERGDGMLWYLNPRNYPRSMYHKFSPGKGPQQESTLSGTEIMDLITAANEAKCNGDPKADELYRKADEWYKHHGLYCHVIPLRDALKVLELSVPLGVMHCLCRKMQRGLEENEANFSCLGVGCGMFKWERWPERYRGGVNFMTLDKAKEWMTYWDKRGMVHLVMNYGGVIGGICNCDYPDCLELRHRRDYDLPNALIKGEYIARVNYDDCDGCGLCVQACQFGANRMEVTTSKVSIDAFRCFGCGLCETACPKRAIYLEDRKKYPALREVW